MQPVSSTEQGALSDEVVALMATDYALELRRRARLLEQQGDMEGAMELYADSVKHLERASSRMPATNALKHDVATLRREDESNESGHRDADRSLIGSVEDRVEAQLDSVVAELEDVLQAAQRARSQSQGRRPARTCKFCGKAANRGYDTCCRKCARCRGAGSHDEGCPAMAAAVPCTDLVPASTVLVQSSEAIDADDTGPAGSSRGAGASAVVRAQVALRALGLDDEWPTELTMREIRRRYMRESLLSHPDKGPEEEKSWRTARFQELSEAYSTLEALMALQESVGQDALARQGDSSGTGSSPGTRCSHPELPSIKGVELETDSTRGGGLRGGPDLVTSSTPPQPSGGVFSMFALCLAPPAKAHAEAV